MTNKNRLPAGYSREVDRKETRLLQVKDSGVNETIEWKEEWNDPDYKESYEERRPRRTRTQNPLTNTKTKLGTLEPPKESSDFSKREVSLLKHIRPTGNKPCEGDKL